jgi:hypothetical protein
MKRSSLILNIVLGCVAVILLLASVKSTSPFFGKLDTLCGTLSRNLLQNGDFKAGDNSWKHDKGVTINGTNACVLANPIKQTRLWQYVNVVSGKTYRLSFDLNGPSKGAFAIFRDDAANKETFFYCNGKNENNRYAFEFVPQNIGKSRIFLSTRGEGTFYYSNVELRKVNTILPIVYIAVAVILLLVLVRSNLLFFIAFLLLALIPIAKMTKDKKSESENRTLAEYKPLFSKDKKFNKNFGSDFNNWLNDHFWIRNDLMLNQNSLKYLIDGKVDNKFVFQGKDKWLFLKGNIRRMAKPDSYYEDIYEDTKNAVKRFNDFCSKNNAKLYIVLAPFGEEVYSEEIPILNITNRVGRFGKYADRLQSDTGATILYALESLQNAKTNALVQYKTDHHWTQLGAWNAYQILRSKIYHDLNITQTYNAPFNLKKHKYGFGYGETFVRVKNINDSLAKKIYPDDASYLRFVVNKDFYCDDNGSRLFNKSGVNKKIFLFGDSYTRNIKNFFGYDFRNTKYMVKPLQIYMPQFEKEIAIYKPDAVVMIIYSQNYNLIKNWYKTDN